MPPEQSGRALLGGHPGDHRHKSQSSPFPSKVRITGARQYRKNISFMFIYNKAVLGMCSLRTSCAPGFCLCSAVVGSAVTAGWPPVVGSAVIAGWPPVVKHRLSAGLSPPGLQPPLFLHQAWMEEGGTSLSPPPHFEDGVPPSEDQSREAKEVTPHGGPRPGKDVFGDASSALLVPTLWP